MDNVVNFMKFKEARDEVIAQDEEMQTATELVFQDASELRDFLMDESEYSPGTFTFTVEEGDE